MFLIALKETETLWMLGEVARELEWKVIVPKQVFIEASKREPQALDFLKTKSKWFEVREPPPQVLTRVSALYPYIGKGELEAFALALALKNDGIQSDVICDDQLARKVANREGIHLLYALDFFKKVHKLQLMTTQDIQNFMPKLRGCLRLSDDVIQKFISKLEIDSEQT